VVWIKVIGIILRRISMKEKKMKLNERQTKFLIDIQEVAYNMGVKIILNEEQTRRLYEMMWPELLRIYNEKKKKRKILLQMIVIQKTQQPYKNHTRSIQEL
jgi:hypothetical protein